jgi:AcrR family transcriptional regulator
MVDLTREHGAERVTVAHVVARAGVSRRTFYEIFADREACLLAALDDAFERIAAVVLPAYRGERGWAERIRAGLTTMLELFDAEPGTAALCVVDALGAGPQALERRAQVIDALVGAVDRGRREAPAASAPNRVTAEGVVGAVLGVLYTRLHEGVGTEMKPRWTAARRARAGPRARGTRSRVSTCDSPTARCECSPRSQAAQV